MEPSEVSETKGLHMLVRMKTNITGARNGEAWPAPGELLDVDGHEGADLIAAGHAEEATDAEAPARTDGGRDGDETSTEDSNAVTAPASNEPATAVQVTAGLAPLVDADGHPADLLDGGPASTALPEEIDLDDLDRDQLATLADLRGVKVRHNASAATIRKALRAVDSA